MAEVEGAGPTAADASAWDRTARKRIGVIGSSNVDLVTRIARMPEAGETLAAQSFVMGHGGKGANQAVAVARLGGDVVFVTRVGDDVLGAQLLQNYRELGIDIAHAHAVPGISTGTATILVEPSGENRIMIAAGANAALTPDAFDGATDSLRACRLLVLQLEVPETTVYRAIKWASAEGIDVLLNPAPAHANLELAHLCAVSFLVPNRGELSVLSGMSTRTMGEVERAACAFVKRGVGTVIVTLGADGALVVDEDGARHFPAPAVTPRDTTGAGDAFVGAFAERWAATGDVAVAVSQAVRYAADSTTRDGAQASYADARGFRQNGR